MLCFLIVLSLSNQKKKRPISILWRLLVKDQSGHKVHRQRNCHTGVNMNFPGVLNCSQVKQESGNAVWTAILSQFSLKITTFTRKPREGRSCPSVSPEITERTWLLCTFSRASASFTTCPNIFNLCPFQSP